MNTETSIKAAITYQYTTCSNSARGDAADFVNLSHRLGLWMKWFTIHKMLSSNGPTNEGDIYLKKESVSQKVGMKYERLTPMSLGLRKDRLCQFLHPSFQVETRGGFFDVWAHDGCRCRCHWQTCDWDVLLSNLRNAITWYQLNVAQGTTVHVTLSKLAQEVSMLSTGMFSDSEGAGEGWARSCGGGVIPAEGVETSWGVHSYKEPLYILRQPKACGAAPPWHFAPLN